jgi:hypothetical protein
MRSDGWIYWIFQANSRIFKFCENGFVCPHVWSYELPGGLTRNLIRTLRHLGYCRLLGFQLPKSDNKNGVDARIYGFGATWAQLPKLGNHGSILEVRGRSSNRKYVLKVTVETGFRAACDSHTVWSEFIMPKCKEHVWELCIQVWIIALEVVFVGSFMYINYLGRKEHDEWGTCTEHSQGY